MKRIQISGHAHWVQVSTEIKNLAAIYDQNSFSWELDGIPGVAFIWIKTEMRSFYFMFQLQRIDPSRLARLRKAVRDEHPGVKL